MALLVNKESDIELRAPTCLMAVEHDQIPPMGLPKEEIGIVHFAYASLKHNLARVTTRRARSMESFELMQFNPCLQQAFGFPPGKKQVKIILLL